MHTLKTLTCKTNVMASKASFLLELKQLLITACIKIHKVSHLYVSLRL